MMYQRAKRIVMLLLSVAIALYSFSVAINSTDLLEQVLFGLLFILFAALAAGLFIE